jgi:hypothetical protein
MKVISYLMKVITYLMKVITYLMKVITYLMKVITYLMKFITVKIIKYMKFLIIQYKRRYQILCIRCVSGITFIRYVITFIPDRVVEWLPYRRLSFNVNNRKRKPKGQYKLDNSETLAPFWHNTQNGDRKRKIENRELWRWVIRFQHSPTKVLCSTISSTASVS